MRKPRDYHAELSALEQRLRDLEDKQLRQLGALVVAICADTLGAEELAGVLLAARGADPAKREAWRKRGATFFSRGRTRGQTRDSAEAQPDDTASATGDATSDRAQPGPA